MDYLTLTATLQGFNAAMSPTDITAGEYRRVPEWDKDEFVCIDIGEDGLEPVWVDGDDKSIEREEAIR